MISDVFFSCDILYLSGRGGKKGICNNSLILLFRIFAHKQDKDCELHSFVQSDEWVRAHLLLRHCCAYAHC